MRIMGGQYQCIVFETHVLWNLFCSGGSKLEYCNLQMEVLELLFMYILAS